MYLVGDVPSRGGSVWSGKCPSRMCLVGEVSFGDVSVGDVFVGEMSVGEVPGHRLVDQIKTKGATGGVL